MEQNKPGKRVAQAAPTPHPARRGLIIVLAVAAALCAAYLALCAYGGSRAAALPRTTAAGVDLSGLTQAQAQTRRWGPRWRSSAPAGPRRRSRG